MHSLPTRSTFVLFFFSLFSETLIQVASQGSALLFAPKTSLTVTQRDAAVGDTGERGESASVCPRPSSLLTIQCRGLFLPHAPSNGRTAGLEKETRGPKELLRAAGVGLPDLAK